MLKIEELRELNDDELAQKAAALRKELFDLRMQQTEGKLSKPHRMRQARRQIAQALTLLGQRRRPASPGAK